jgi:hypothetical protein
MFLTLVSGVGLWSVVRDALVLWDLSSCDTATAPKRLKEIKVPGALYTCAAVLEVHNPFNKAEPAFDVVLCGSSSATPVHCWDCRELPPPQLTYTAAGNVLKPPPPPALIRRWTALEQSFAQALASLKLARCSLAALQLSVLWPVVVAPPTADSVHHVTRQSPLFLQTSACALVVVVTATQVNSVAVQLLPTCSGLDQPTALPDLAVATVGLGAIDLGAGAGAGAAADVKSADAARVAWIVSAVAPVCTAPRTTVVAPNPLPPAAIILRRLRTQAQVLASLVFLE